MRRHSPTLTVLLASLLSDGLAAACARPLFAHLPPTPAEIVTQILELAEVGPNVVVYVLGSGDGRIVIEAAKRFGARGVGIEVNDELIRRSVRNARAAGVADRVQFIR